MRGKLKTLHTYCPTSIGTNFRTELVHDVKVQIALLKYNKFWSFWLLTSPKYEFEE